MIDMKKKFVIIRYIFLIRSQLVLLNSTITNNYQIAEESKEKPMSIFRFSDSVVEPLRVF